MLGWLILDDVKNTENELLSDLRIPNTVGSKLGQWISIRIY